MDGGAWWAAVHGVAKSQTRLSDFTFTFPVHALEKEMATHSSVLAWRIPGMVKPGGLPSMGSHRVRHNWRDLEVAAVFLQVWGDISLWFGFAFPWWVSDVEHLSMLLLAICISTLEKFLFSFYAHLKVFFFFLTLHFWGVYICWILTPNHSFAIFSLIQ